MTQHARMLAKSREYQIGTYICKFVAPEFQRLIRLEAATQEPRREPAMVECQLSSVWREIGECVCVTCGRVAAWKGNQIGGGEMVGVSRGQFGERLGAFGGDRQEVTGASGCGFGLKRRGLLDEDA